MISHHLSLRIQKVYRLLRACQKNHDFCTSETNSDTKEHQNFFFLRITFFNIMTDAQIFSITQLESNCVAKKNKHRYHSTNFHFVLWLHEHHPDYVKVAVREAITIIKATTEHQPKSKQDAQLRRLIVDDYLAKVVKNEDEYMPIHLDMFVDYKVFAEYIAQKRKTVKGIQKFLSINSYTSIRSSIVHLFKMSTHSLRGVAVS